MPHRVRSLLSRIPAVRHVEEDKTKMIEVQRKISRDSQGRDLLIARAEAVASRALAYGDRNHFSEKVDAAFHTRGGEHGLAH